MYMELFVYPQIAIERGLYERRYPYLLISITSPGVADVTVPDDENCLRILRLRFDDADSDPAGEYTLFSAEHAQQIADALLDLPMSTNVIVHCAAGISRSSAVAAAITRYFGWQEEEFFSPPYCPNRLVYQLLSATMRTAHITRMRERLSAAPVDARIERLRYLLSQATNTFSQPLPWGVTGVGDMFPMVTDANGRDLVQLAGGRPYLFVSAADLIAEVITELPGLLDALQVQEACPDT
jgi:predicted protein tyrosine phosphatase